MRKATIILTWIIINALISTASAAVDPANIIKLLICKIYCQLRTVIAGLAFLMYLYAGSKYAFSADDPGGRKQAKAIALNALIGLIIVASAKSLVEAAGGSAAVCDCTPYPVDLSAFL